MPDLNFKIEDTIIQGDKVAMRLTLTGTYKTQLFPFTALPGTALPGPVPGKIRATEMLMFQLKDGKIAEIWEEYDEVAMRYQMGGVWSNVADPAAASTTGPGSKAPPSPKR